MTTSFSYFITQSYDNLKIQSVLKRFGFSDTLIKSLKTCSSAVCLDTIPAKMTDCVHRNQTLSVTLSEKPSLITPSDLPLDILYEDDDIIAVNKPRNMPTHPSYEHTSDTLANAVMHYFGSDFTFHAITRLDKDTSGVVLIAKHALSAHLLTKSIKSDNIQKNYLAVVCGIPSPLKGRIDAPIEKQGGLLRAVSENGKTALTFYETLKHNDTHSFVSLNPITGRTHQLRVHMAHIATPIYGDILYNPNFSDGVLRLHCSSLAFVHPITKKQMTLTAPLPSDMDMI